MDVHEFGRKFVPVTVAHVSSVPAVTLDGEREVTVGAGTEGGFAGVTVHNSDMLLPIDGALKLHCVPLFCVTSIPIDAAAP